MPCLIVLIFLLSFVGANAWGTAMPQNLSCEGRWNPCGVDAEIPRLSWMLAVSPKERGVRQSAYQILAASSPLALTKNRGDVWDSGRVQSAQSLWVPYAGRPLTAAQRVFWKVRVWDEHGLPSAWSRSAEWTMSLLQPGDWTARWIGADSKSLSCETLLLRREFSVKMGLRRALAFVSGLGHYEMTLNGIKAGDDLLTPGWTNYRKTVLYDTRDITSQLKPGINAVGLFLGNGMYNVQKGRYTKFTGSFGPQKAIAQIRLEYSDGSVRTIVTDQNWRAAAGPITFSSVYGGEDFDARLVQKGWDRAGFDASGWTPIAVMPGPGGELKCLSRANPPIRAFETFKPVASKVIAPNTTIYDLGQNASLMPRLTLHGSAGAVVRIIPAELVHEDGTIDRSSVGDGEAYWQYTLTGNGAEHYFPRFFYHGGRYLQVECTASPGGNAFPVVDSLEGIFIHAASPAVGTFASSNPLLDRIGRLVRWAQMSNMVSVMTDCPHRERLGWLEEDHLNGPALRYNFGMTQMFTKIVNDMADAQLENGLIPSIAPEYVQFGATTPTTRNAFGDSPEWGSAMVLVPWQQYEFDGDLEMLHRHYDGMVRYVAYLNSRAQNDIVDYGLGDWYDIGPRAPGYSQLTPRALTATAFLYQDTVILAKAAALLGKKDDAARSEQKAAQIRMAFNTKFYDPVTHQYATGSQCANAIPLVMGLAPTDARLDILTNIVKDVQEKGLTAGDVGYRYLLRALADGGRSDVVYALNNQSVKPGYGMQLARGATSLTEAWDARRSSSQNHFMLGQINEWFYHDLAGIQPDGPGFSKIVIKPAIVGDLTSVGATYQSGYGPIESAWTRHGRYITLQVSIPANTTAMIYVPAQNVADITEESYLPGRALGIKLLRSEGGYRVYAVGSGRYQFQSTYASPVQGSNHVSLLP